MTKYYRENYPRPQFVRNSYLDLNGKWNFRFDDKNEGLSCGWYKGFEDCKILVPFSYETVKSGIGCTQSHEIIWYSRSIDFASIYGQGKNVILNFEGVDYKTELWVNGVFIGAHEGGYTRFSFDITGAVHTGENVLTLRIQDSFSTIQPRGKQRWLKENYDCWYVQTTGIWKSVWAEAVEEIYLRHLHIIPRYDENSVDLEYQIENTSEGKQIEVETIITYKDDLICSHREILVKENYTRRFSLENDNVKWKVKYWCPKSPHLYDVCVRIYYGGILCDEVGSYFGLRKISALGNRIQLNNMDYYLRMILDQGYWKDSGLTPPDDEAIKKNIDEILAYGYNGVRKHQKIEDDRFYYWADVKGVLVWCEAPSFYELDNMAVGKVTSEWMDIVMQHYNHPSIITWVPFNESWGIPRVIKDKKAQHFTQSLYYLTKTLDDTRLVISNDGWEHTKSDIITLHDYASDGKQLKHNWRYPEENLSNLRAFNGERYAFAEGYKYEGQPLILSEFGGIAYGNTEEGWGYGEEERDEEDYLRRLESLIDAVLDMGQFCGFCMTQLTDVEQEQNGHMYMDHSDKIVPEKVAHIIRKME